MYYFHTLRNGIRIVFSQNNSTVTHSGVYINIGSRDEKGDNEGMAHFIEHTLFKGTQHRKAFHILNRIDGVGGELNAFTTKEETCIYASSLNIHLERCLELFSDILFHSIFPKNEIEKEKDVVLEEINSYKDYPSEQIYDDFEEKMFEGHALSHNILGTRKNVKRFTTESIQQFFQNHYTTDRMAISIVGPADFKKVVRLCEKYFGDYPYRTSLANRSNVPTPQHFDITLNRHTHQMHALIGCPAPNAFDEKKVAFTLMNNILGGPAMNSRLNVAVREKHGFCYTIESQYTPFSDTGLFYIYAGIEAEAKDKFRDIVRHELWKLKEKPLSTLQLHAAQQQFIAQMAISNEQALNEMQSIGKAYMVYDRVDTLEEMANDINSVNATQIQDLAAELFSDETFSYLFYV